MTDVAARLRDEDWHGWSVIGRGAIHVGHLPGRKSACLYVVRSHEHGGSALDVLAFFSSEEKASEALTWLDSLARTVGGVS